MRGMHREHSLNANARCNTTNGKGLVDASMLLGNNGAFKHLDSLFDALFDLNRNTHGITLSLIHI